MADVSHIRAKAKERERLEHLGWALEDVADVQTYSASIVRNKFSALPDSMREEAREEALCLVFALHKKWRPEDCPSFKDFLSYYLPLRLIDWWRTTGAQNGRIKNVDTEGTVTYDAPTVPSGLADDFVPDSTSDPGPSPYDLLVDLGSAA